MGRDMRFRLTEKRWLNNIVTVHFIYGCTYHYLQFDNMGGIELCLSPQNPHLDYAGPLQVFVGGFFREGRRTQH